MMSIFVNVGLYHFLLIGLLLFLVGIFGTIISKNLLRVLISIEIMFSGITLNFATCATYCDEEHFKGSVFALFIIVMATIHIAVGVAIVINLFNFKNTVNIENIGELKG